MKYEKNNLYSYMSPIILILLSLFGIWFLGLFLVDIIKLCFSNPTLPGQFDVKSFFVLGLLPLLLFILSIVMLVLSIILLRKGTKSIEINSGKISLNHLDNSSYSINTKDVTQLVYADVSTSNGIHSEIRIYTNKFLSKRQIIMIINFPELFSNYKSLFSELETTTGLKFENIKEYSNSWGKKVISK